MDLRSYGKGEIAGASRTQEHGELDTQGRLGAEETSRED